MDRIWFWSIGGVSPNVIKTQCQHDKNSADGFHYFFFSISHNLFVFQNLSGPVPWSLKIHAESTSLNPNDITDLSRSVFSKAPNATAFIRRSRFTVSEPAAWQTVPGELPLENLLQKCFFSLERKKTIWLLKPPNWSSSCHYGKDCCISKRTQEAI